MSQNEERNHGWISLKTATVPCLGQLSAPVPISHGHMDGGHHTNLVTGGSTWHIEEGTRRRGNCYKSCRHSKGYLMIMESYRTSSLNIYSNQELPLGIGYPEELKLFRPFHEAPFPFSDNCSYVNWILVLCNTHQLSIRITLNYGLFFQTASFPTRLKLSKAWACVFCVSSLSPWHTISAK